MATRTVINANATALPPTRGISIIIDQPQQLQQQQQQQRQRQQVATEQQQRGHSSKTSVSPTAAAAPATFPSSTTSSAYPSLGSDGNNYNRHTNNSSNYNNSHGYTTTLSTANKSSNFSTTFIDLNREDGADAEAEDDDGQKPRTCLSGRLSVRPSEAGQKTTTATKTSSTKITATATATAATTTTIQETETTTTTTFPQLLLKVAGPEWVRHNNNNNNKNHNNNTSMSQSSSVTTTTTFAPLSERRKAKADVARSGGGDETAEAADTVGKAASDSAGERAASRSTNNSAGSSETKTETKSDTNTGAGAEAGIGISITHGRRESAADDEVVTTTTIIECNRDRQRGPHADHGDDDGDDDEVVESRRLGSRSRAGVGAGAGVGVGVAVGVGAGAARVDGGGRGARASHSQWPQLEATNTASSLEAADCASALTESVASAEENSHVVKIKISPSASASEDEDTTLLPSLVVDPRNNRARPTPRPQNKVSEKQVTVVQLNEPRPVVRVAHELAPVATTKPKLANELAKELANVPELDRELGKSSGQSADRKMVQKPSSSGVGQNGGPTLGAVTSGNTTVTELNVSSPSSSYLYYMMSSGQFSPCDTLDSGTGSDLEGSGHGLCLAGSSPPKVPAKGAGVPKLELHLKSTKIRVNTNEVEKHDGDGDDGAEHQRANSLTDSEESESSLSCDSLNSSDYLRQSSSSPTAAAESQEPPPLPPLPPPSAAEGVPKSPLGSFLPDSLLRDIRDRKFPTNDFVAKYVDRAPPYDSDSANVNVNDDADADDNNNENDSRGNDGHGNANGIDYVQEAVEHAKYVRERNCSNANASARQRASLPSKTFVLNAADGSFVDTKLNSMPRRYEADKYYDFHVNEHENFRSFGNGNGSVNGDGCSEAGSWAEYEARGLQDDAFAGYRDIRCSSAASTIRSSKGTVRGVKNRVRNGIATFLQLQQPNAKNYKEKDLGKVVLYTTSMGIIRDTYAKCSNMKQILRTLLVKFEERDVFMSVEYQQEIKERMHSEAIKVPQLFVEGQHIGDADTVERLNESGELRQLLKPYKSIATTYTCQTCGGYRLLPCPSCNGSKKSVHRNHFTAEFVALKCMNCDEVGLVKCHNC